MFSFNQQTVQNVENGQTLVEDNEDSKNRENFQGKEQRNTQVGDKMKEDGEENERETSELDLAFEMVGAVPYMVQDI